MKSQHLRRYLNPAPWLVILLALTAGCARLPQAPAPTSVASFAATVTALPPGQFTPLPADYWPTRGWRTSAPEQQGIDSQALAQMLEEVKQQKLDLHSLLVIRNGYVVSETYFGIYGPDTTHELYSCTKSFISTLVGIAIEKGYLDRIDRPVKDFLPGRTWANPDPRKDAMTLENLLTMTSGLAWAEGDPIYQQMYASRDWLQFVMDTPQRDQPGTVFDYCSGCSHVLSAILQQQTGTTTRDFADRQLFEPLGISNYDWHTDAQGIAIGGWGLQLTPRDMAKLGYLYLHRGIWEGKQIVPAGWVENAISRHTGTDGPLGYGYQWWIYPTWGAYTARGRFGQLIFVIPNLNVVVVTTAQANGDDEIFRLIEKYIVPGARKM